MFGSVFVDEVAFVRVFGKGLVAEEKSLKIVPFVMLAIVTAYACVLDRVCSSPPDFPLTLCPCNL